VQAFEWAVYSGDGHGGEPSARHSGITDAEAKAMEHVEAVMSGNRACAAGAVWVSEMVISSTQELTYQWVRTEYGADRHCTRTPLGGYQWSGELWNGPGRPGPYPLDAKQPHDGTPND
jgi:hypothetical protein